MKNFLLNRVTLGAIVAGIIIAILVLFAPEPRPVHAASSFATIICDQSVPISAGGSATTKIVTAGNANMFIYVCAYNFGSIGGSSFSFIEGTGASCGTGTAALIGGTTAAAGLGLPANGVTNAGSGVGMLAKTATAGDNVCVISAGTGPLAGVVSFTTAPY